MSRRVEESGDVPDDFRSWWWTERQLWWRDIDELGHLTAARYADLYQEACGDFVEEAWGPDDAAYVVARIDTVYLSEIRLSESPVRVYARATKVGRSSFTLSMVVCSATGRLSSSAEGTYVAWDRARRGGRAMTEVERASLAALGARHVPGETGTQSTS